MEIFENRPQYYPDFVSLNKQWLDEYFEIEDIDHELFANPQKIVDAGGYIFSLVINYKVVGVCALFYNGPGDYELARMAVDSQHQGKGYSNILMQVCLVKLRMLAAEKVSLVSNTKLVPAISLYKKHGFVTVSEKQHPVYKRANIEMVQYL